MNDENVRTASGDSDAIVDVSPRCWRCNRKLGELLTRPWEVTCTRCKATNARGVRDREEGAVASISP